MRSSTVVCRLSVCHSSEPCKNGWTDRDAVWVVDLGASKEACVTWGAHWHNLVNTTEPSVCGSDAALCQTRNTFGGTWYLPYGWVGYDRHCHFSVHMCETALFLLSVWNLTVGTVKMVNLRHRTKFRGDQSDHCGDMAIFRFFQNGGCPPSWICDARV